VFGTKPGNVSEWSERALWYMGILNENDWKALWIGAPWQGRRPLPESVRNEKPARARC